MCAACGRSTDDGPQAELSGSGSLRGWQRVADRRWLLGRLRLDVVRQHGKSIVNRSIWTSREARCERIAECDRAES